MTEMHGGRHCRKPRAPFKFGTVGWGVPGGEIQIAEEDGEILMKRTEHLQGVLAQRRGDLRTRWSTAGSTPVMWGSLTRRAS